MIPPPRPDIIVCVFLISQIIIIGTTTYYKPIK